MGLQARFGIDPAGIIRIGRAWRPGNAGLLAAGNLRRHRASENDARIAQAAFRFLPTRARLDLAGWPDVDIFEH